MSRNAILSLYNRRPPKVETQNLASPEEEYAMRNGGNMQVICVCFASPEEEYAMRNGGNMQVSAVSFACETQNFASLLG